MPDLLGFPMQIIRPLKLILTLSCDQATRLMSDSHDRSLQKHERIALRCHQVSCSGCKRTHRQFNLLRVIAGYFSSQGREDLSASLPKDARQRIEERLKI